MKKRTSKLLNLGCGSRYFDDWTNVDFHKTGPDVIASNLTRGIPFPDASFDVVYHSHVLEHFSKSNGAFFLRECHRVLSPGGILRVVVPDLEQIAREYLNNLQRSLNGEDLAYYDYDWSLLELLDQMVRDTSGGEMGRYWSQPLIPNEKYIESRMGEEYRNFRRSLGGSKRQVNARATRLPWSQRLISLFGRDKEAIKYQEIGKFRSGGEVHLWMYDRYSLAKLLTSCSFKNVRKVDAFTSNIPDWERYLWLDVENGKVRKPDSLFLECEK